MVTRKKKSLLLEVFLNKDRVGTLTKRESGALEFKYHKQWVDDPKSIPLSQGLPLIKTPYKGESVLAFFENLLPDNPEIKKQMARVLKATSSETFDLLSTSGRDCIGAFLFIPSDRPPPPPDLTRIKGKAVDDREIEDILKKLVSHPLGHDLKDDFRISLAGMQEKTGLLLYKKQWWRPEGTTPTSHIFKPPLGKSSIDMSTSVENEWLCAQIVRKFSLEVAPVEIMVFGNQKCLVIERFDRKWSEDKKILERIPQEDLCQALGTSLKYENDGGPGIKRIMAFLNTSDRPSEDRTSFLKTQVVFFLLAATDGHAKNFSIFHTQTGFKLTPLYDILSIHPLLAQKKIQKKEARLAMAVGDSRHYRLAKIGRQHWFETAKICHFPREKMNTILDEVQGEAEKLLKKGIDLPPKFPERIYTDTMSGIKKFLSRLDG